MAYVYRTMSAYKFSTPHIPDEIRRIRHPAYKNIYEYGLGNQNLWGTESLLGDWNGEYLLIAKDFYPSCYIDAAIDAGDQQPYRHKPTAPTNRNLIKTLAHFNRFPPIPSNTTCGFLYTSACFLLRADGKKRGKLPDEAEALRRSYPAIEFTINHLPNLRHAVLMGNEASSAVLHTPLLELLQCRGVQVHRVCHPANAMTDAKRFSEWESVFGDVAVVDRPNERKGGVEPAERNNQLSQAARSRVLVLAELGTTPISAEDLARRTKISDVKKVRNAIDQLRNEYCIWRGTARPGFWIDDPIKLITTTKLREDSGRWEREPDHKYLD